MKKDLIFIGMIFLGVSMIISSLILSKPQIKQEQFLNTSLNGSLYQNVSSSESNLTSGDILQPYYAGLLLGYDQEDLIAKIIDGTLEGIPYVKIGNHYVFSKKALEEWIYNQSVKK